MHDQTTGAGNEQRNFSQLRKGEKWECAGRLPVLRGEISGSKAMQRRGTRFVFHRARMVGGALPDRLRAQRWFARIDLHMPEVQ